MSSGPPPYTGPKEPDDNLGTSLTRFIWTCTAISTVDLVLRLAAVYMFIRRVRAADYVMVAAFLCVVAAGALVTRGIHWGLGRHIYYLSPDQIQNVVEYIILMLAPVITGVLLGRVSFCLFLLSTLGGERNVQAILWITILLQALVNVLQIILQYSSCGLHISALWNQSIPMSCIPFQSISDYLYFLSAWNTFTDLFLTLLPAYLLKDLHIPLRKKIVVMILLCISGLIFVASLVKSIMAKDLANEDKTWGYAKLLFWVFGKASPLS